jgi:signal transduction histidine kinase
MNEQKKVQELHSEIQAYKEQVTDFIESAAHDLHAPLRKLSVLVERLIVKHESVFDTDGKEYVHRIQACIAEMKSLIDGLTGLAGANIEAGNFTSCDLNIIVDQTLKTLREEIEEKNISLTVDHLPTVSGNCFQYGQLFKNIFENAIKFTNNGTAKRIAVKGDELTEGQRDLLQLDEHKKYFRLEIEDNGIGFKQDYAEKIFQPFVRLHPRSMYQGSGLGLAICKKIVANHKGIIYAEGNENRGARFVLILPQSP